MNLHSCQWWQELWRRSDSVRIKECKELVCHDEAWRDWLGCDNEYARRDIKMMEAEGGNYFNLVSIIGIRT